MKFEAAVIREHGSFDKILFEQREVSHPKDSQCLIQVKACGLNHLDTWVRRGVPGHRFPLPLVPGSDFSGIVVETGPAVKHFKAGDRVLINPSVTCGWCANCQAGKDHLCEKWGLLGETTDGGCQELVLVPESNLYVISPNLSFEQAACIPIAYVTAWEMLLRKAQVRHGETILIHAAGSGVSVACIQIAKMLGLQVIATSTSDEKLQQARGIGAHKLINSAKDNFREAVRNLTGKSGVDVVVDHVGEATFNESIRCLKKGGRLVSCGATAGASLAFDWKQIFFKNIALLGSTYGPKSVFNEVLNHFETKQLAPVIDSHEDFRNLSHAHQRLESRKVFGKVVIKFSERA